MFNTFDFTSHPAAKPPRVGNIRNNHTCARAVPPTKTAGPRVRARLTDNAPTKVNREYRPARVSPVAKAPTGVVAFFLVAAKVDKRDKKDAEHLLNAAAPR